MGISKVEIKNSDGTKNVLVDLTGDTVTAENLLEGITAHGADGNAIIGTLNKDVVESNIIKVQGSVVVDSSTTFLTIDTGLDTIDGIIVCESPTNGNTDKRMVRWVYGGNFQYQEGWNGDEYNLVNYQSTNYMSFSGGTVTLNAYWSGRPILSGTYDWIAYGTGAVENSNIVVKEIASVKIPSDAGNNTEQIVFDTMLNSIDGFMVFETVSASGETVGWVQSQLFSSIIYKPSGVTSENLFKSASGDSYISVNGGTVVLTRESADNLITDKSTFVIVAWGDGVCEKIYTGDATLTPDALLSEKTAYVCGKKVIGTLPKTINGVNQYYSNGVVKIKATHDNIDYLRFKKTMTSNRAFLQGSLISLDVPYSDFGDATASDVAVGKTFTSSDGLAVTGAVKTVTTYTGYKDITPQVNSFSGTNYICLNSPDIGADGVLFKEGSHFYLGALPSEFGDATASDVAKGKTFTSSAGLKVTGTAEATTSNDNCEAYQITSASTALSFKRTDGTIKVWGYGYYSSGTYMRTTYAFVGDGYYTASSYGTPSKTSATFGINSDGTLSGLPRNLTTVNLLVTKGV